MGCTGLTDGLSYPETDYRHAKRFVENELYRIYCEGERVTVSVLKQLLVLAEWMGIDVEKIKKCGDKR